MDRRMPLVALVAACLLAGCAGGGGTGSAGPASPHPSPATSSGLPSPDQPSTTATPSAAPSSAAPSPTDAPLTRPTKVLVVIEENHSRDQMLAQMPHLAAWARRYGMATRWKALVHPSEPNYLAIVGGSMFSIADDRSPARNAAKVGSADNVFARAIRAGRTARTYAESMPSPCALESRGDYAVRHNPWTYFPADRANCARFDVDTQHFADDARANRLPDVGLLVPNLVHDAHDGSLAAADAWLATTLAPVLHSADFLSGRLVVVVTADEDDKHAGNTVLTAVLSPCLRHEVVDTRLDHYSLHRFLAEIAGVEPLAHGAGAADMRAAFGL